MAFYDTTWYCNFGDGSTTGYYAVTVRPQNTAVAAGVLRRQFTAPAVGSERVFVCIVAGTTANTTDATWTTTRGAKTTDGTATWQECTGASAVNGDLTNTPTWTQAKAIGSPTLGAIIKRNNGASYQICSTAGSLGASEPAFSDTAGVTTTESTTTWTSLGAVGNFTGGQAPHARLANACASNWFAAGNTIYVGDNHAETLTSALNPNPAVSASTMGRAICHNHSGSYPPAAGDITTGASISTTTATNMTFTIGGGFYLYGLTFKVGVGQSTGAAFTLSTSNGWAYVDACSFEIATTSASSATITIGAGSYGTVTFNNTTVKFGNTGQKIIPTNCQFTWQNTGPVLVSGSSVPVTFLAPSSVAGPMVLEALDLSQLSGSLCSNSTIITNLLIKDCKLHASATVDTPTAPGSTLQLVRCDSGATAYKSTRYAYEGTETTETSITRVGGAVDPNTQAQTRKIVTTANAQWQRPFTAEPYAIWNPTTGSNVIVTVYGTINAGAVPNNDDIWIEVEYLGSGSTPLGSLVNTTKANLLTTNAAVASDGSSWNGGGSGAGWSPFKLTTTLSSPQPGLSGYIDVRVRAAKATTTYYIDPKIVLT
jgi:hypothetical protein